MLNLEYVIILTAIGFLLYVFIHINTGLLPHQKAMLGTTQLSKNRAIIENALSSLELCGDGCVEDVHLGGAPDIIIDDNHLLLSKGNDTVSFHPMFIYVGNNLSKVHTLRLIKTRDKIRVVKLE